MTDNHSTREKEWPAVNHLAISMRKKITTTCAYCGKSIEKLPQEVKSSKHGNVFCNRSCACSFNNSTYRKGKDNPNWKDGTYKSSNYAKDAFRTYMAKCAICGLEEPACLQVHHIDLDRDNIVTDNLIILCANHHCMVHYGSLVISEEIKSSREMLGSNPIT